MIENLLALKQVNGFYVFTHIGNEPILAGRFKLIDGVGSFIYNEDYLKNSLAYPIDPINLPLEKNEFKTTANKGFFGALLDAGPDQWGRKVYSYYYGREIQSEMESLLAASGGGVGSLLFSLNRNKPIRSEHHKIQLNEIDSIHNVINNLIEDNALNKDIINLLLDGSSIGGARPKVSINDEYHTWIAKFNRPNDSINQAKTEHIFLEIAYELGIKTVRSRLHHFNDDDVLMIKRFDKKSYGPKHFISAQSLFNVAKVPVKETKDHPYSYLNLANIIKKITINPDKELNELFNRLIYNVLIHNIDDHAKNHGFLYHSEKGYTLSPAFDLVPQIGKSKKHSLIIGDYGRTGSIKNILSVAEDFNKSKEEALAIIKDYQKRIPLLFEEKSEQYKLSNNDKKLLQSNQHKLFINNVKKRTLSL